MRLRINTHWHQHPGACLPESGQPMEELQTCPAGSPDARGFVCKQTKQNSNPMLEWPRTEEKKYKLYKLFKSKHTTG